MLSICVALKNRSRVNVGGCELLLFPHCVDSIVRSLRDAEAELIVADWESDDWPLNEWLPQAVGTLSYQVVTCQGAFSRGQGLNIAANVARGDALFFTDADSLLCPAVIHTGLQCAKVGKAYFPIIFCFSDAEHQRGRWQHHGYGNCVVTRRVHETAGGWPEYKFWGKEDDDYFARVKQFAPIVREELPGFSHQWHPDDILWKDRYGARDPAAIEEIKLARQAMRELCEVVPPRESFILIDEARFGVDGIEGRRAYPFMEKYGEYAGPPADDATAISELERLRHEGAKYIAFAWMAFWWLDYYPGLHRHLRSAGRCVLQNERLVVFALS